MDQRATDRRHELQSMTRLAAYLERLSAGGFFGKVVLSFQNGKISEVKIEQTKKLDEL
jgi:hypothetical protein